MALHTNTASDLNLLMSNKLGLEKMPIITPDNPSVEQKLATVPGQTLPPQPQTPPSTAVLATAVPAPVVPKVPYSSFVNVNGTIYNKISGFAYSDPNQLASDLGILPNQIDWKQILPAQQTPPTIPSPSPKPSPQPSSPATPPAPTPSGINVPPAPPSFTREDIREGDFVQVPGTFEVFQMKNGEMRHVANPEVGAAIGLQPNPTPGTGFANVKAISTEDLQSFRRGLPITHAPSLTQNPEEYLMDLINRTEASYGLGEAESRIVDLEGQIFDFLQGRTPKSQLVEEELARRGIPQKEDILTDLNRAILTQTQMLRQLPEDIREGVRDFLVTEGQLNRLIVSETTKPAEVLRDLLEQRGVLQADVDRATTFAFQMADTKYADEAARLDALSFMLESKQGQYNRLSQKVATAINLGIEVRRDQIKRAQDLEDQERGTKLQLMLKYPGSGISLADDLDTAFNKASIIANEVQKLELEQARANLALTKAQTEKALRPDGGGAGSLGDILALAKFKFDVQKEETETYEDELKKAANNALIIYLGTVQASGQRRFRADVSPEKLREEAIKNAGFTQVKDESGQIDTTVGNILDANEIVSIINSFFFKPTAPK